MHNNVKICTFNCHSFTANIDVVRDLCDKFDIILLQETFLTDESKIESYIGSNLSFFSTLAEFEYFSGRPKGGLLIIWHSDLDSHVKRVACDNNRINGIQLVSDRENILILNIYAPFDNHTIENYNEYIVLLSQLGEIIESNSATSIVIMGDFNADPRGGRLWDELNEFTNELQFSIADLCLSPDTFSFLSPAHNTTSWLDHVIESRSGLVSNICVMYDSVLFDHFPVSCNIHFQKSSIDEPPVPLHTSGENIYVP